MADAQKSQFSQIEEQMLEVWDKEQTFEASLKQREGGERFSFYDGPPFANGLPHYGHALASTEKDAITRYKTMRGYYVPRRAGWDTHGLPVEYEVEKQLKLSGKQEILKMGIDKFNQACRDSVFKYKGEWEQFLRRFGRWIDLKNAYATLDDSYIESVWWVFSELHKKDLVTKGFRSMPYCPRCATPLSNFELNQGYQDDVEDPSVYVTFPLVDDPKTVLLAWTTTPWTLPANAALAVDPKADYVTVELQDGQRLILAKQQLEILKEGHDSYKVLETKKGKDLVGLGYEPLYTLTKLTAEEAKTAYHVYADESVSLEDGTGILHVAPRYGETDLELGLKEGLPLIESVDKFGKMTEVMGDFAGLFFKAADEPIIADLTHKGRVFSAETFKHTYPFCWRCDTPLMYFATPTWLVKVTELRDRLVKNNAQIHWVPGHIKDGRFGNWLSEARDWGISRNRFWGAPLPIWVNEANEDDFLVVSSIEELKKLSGASDFDMHRPGIDEVVIEKGGKTYRRVEEVFDCWFESGSMPYGEDHYPFENEGNFKAKFPADFIAEGMDQTRGWFYTLHVLATALFDSPAFKHVIVNGTIVAADGRKLSKRLKNYPEPQAIFDQYGVDSLRFFLSSSPAMAGEDVRFSDDAVREVYRNVFMTLFNTYTFLTMYAKADGWKPAKQLTAPASDDVLDRWILARLNQTIAEVTKRADAYEIAKATRPLRELLEDLSNWYVRRSRRRFWKSKNDNDKAHAYATLHFVLLRVCQLIAPWSPFLSDHIYRELTKATDLPASVHLTDWPTAESVDTKLLELMSGVREVINEALSQRAAAKIKVRQPLQSVVVTTTLDIPPELQTIIAEEVNVKSVKLHSDKLTKVELDTKLTEELKVEGLARELVRVVQAARKQAGLNVSDRIKLELFSDSHVVQEAVAAHRDYLAAETLARDVIVHHNAPAEDLTQLSVEGATVGIRLAKTTDR